MTFEIRRARAQDVARLPAIERQAAALFDHLREETGLTDEALAAVTPLAVLQAAAAAGHLWVAVTPEANLAGFVLVRNVGGYLHVDELDVLPTHARRGIGSALLSAVCTWAASEGYPGVTLRTFRDVPWNAPFYARRGFEIVPSRQLSAAHVEIEHAEQERGLRTDLRVSMRYAFPD